MTILYMFLMCILTSTGQVLVKKGINRHRNYYLDPYILLGGMLIVFAPLLYIKIVREIGLTNAYGLNGLSYIIIYFMSILFLKEKISLLQTIGLAIITVGVIIWSI